MITHKELHVRESEMAKSLVFASAKMRPLKSLIAENIEKLQKG
jgi:hypothetical protein